MTTESATTAETPAEPTPTHKPRPARWPHFVEIPDLPGKPVDVTLVFKDERGATVLDRQSSITPKLTYPNGRDCGPDGRQARLTVTSTEPGATGT
ncbi:hypothetical protein ACIQNU_11190 [Streptomyces sp. NPDC091292]|uniref:hypothetical protein n=1 Tax=Streptomyces sp. NPDC091292 TaxID=3365991 RepID=UPI0037FA9FE8